MYEHNVTFEKSVQEIVVSVETETIWILAEKIVCYPIHRDESEKGINFLLLCIKQYNVNNIGKNLTFHIFDNICWFFQESLLREYDNHCFNYIPIHVVLPIKFEQCDE